MVVKVHKENGVSDSNNQGMGYLINEEWVQGIVFNHLGSCLNMKRKKLCPKITSLSGDTYDYRVVWCITMTYSPNKSIGLTLKSKSQENNDVQSKSMKILFRAPTMSFLN